MEARTRCGCVKDDVKQIAEGGGGDEEESSGEYRGVPVR